MEQTQRSAEKQVIIRMYQPDMQLLKATAREMHGTPGLRLGMYGQAGEVLVVAAGQSGDPQLSADIAEDAAAQFEGAMGECVYGFGRTGLAQVTAQTLEKEENTFAAANDETGRWLEAEMQTAPDADKVFDFGQRSYADERMADKIADAAVLDDEETQDPLQQAADRSYAAHKCTKRDFGVAITGTQGGASMVCAAVTYKKLVYVRCIRPDKDAGKTAALTILDTMRRLTLGQDVPYARVFRAGHEIDWNEPLSDDVVQQGGGGGKVLPILLVIVLIAALAGIGWYAVKNFLFKDSASAVPASASVSAAAQSTPASASASAPAASAQTTTAAAVSGATAADGAATTAAAGGNGVVHPF